MTKRKSIAVVTAGVLLISGPAHAVQGVISGETQLLTSILVQELAQVASLADSVANLKNLVAGINDVIAAGRTAVRIAQSMATFDPNRILQDMETAVRDAFPEANDLLDEIEDLDGNVRAAGRGGDRFWNRYTAADFRTDQRAEKAARFGLRASALNLLGPVVQRMDPTDTDKLLERYHQASATSLKRAMRQSAWGQFVKRLKAHDRDAQQNRNLEAQIEVVGAATALETANNTAELLDIEKTKAARAQAEREYREHLNKKINEGLKGGLLRPAFLREPGR